MSHEQLRSVHLISDEIRQYQTCKDVMHDLYLNKLLLHPDQIEHIKLSQLADMNKHYVLIHLIIRSAAERDLFIFKILNYTVTNKQLRLNPKHHGQRDLLSKLHKKVMIINFACSARCIHHFNYNQSQLTKTLNACIISRWKGIAIMNTQTENKFIEINIPIEPYHRYYIKQRIQKKKNKKNNRDYIRELHKLQKPYLLTLKIFRENVDQIIPTTNDEIRGYQINLNSIPIINKLKTIRNKENTALNFGNCNKEINSALVCRWNDGYCPKQKNVFKACRYTHLSWLEPGVDDGNDNIIWRTANKSKSVPAAMLNISGLNNEEFNMDSNQLIDIIQYCSIIRTEFVTTKDQRSYQLLDDRLNKICKNKVKDESKAHNLRTLYPNNINLIPSFPHYHSPYIYGDREHNKNNNIYALKSYMKKWNDNGHHNTSFALKACITNWPKMFIPHDIDQMLLTQIEQDLVINDGKQTQVINALLTISNNMQFRDKYLKQYEVSAAEIYLNAKHFHEKQEKMQQEENYYAMKYIKILPFHIHLNIKYIQATQLFTNSVEGKAYAKLQFITNINNNNNYKPYHFQPEADTLKQVNCVLYDGIIIANTRYKLIWYGDNDCKQTQVTMISAQLLPAGYTVSGLKIKYSLNKMLNQQYRMRHISALETTATRMAQNITFQCITYIKDDKNIFDGCGIINDQWLKLLITENKLFKTNNSNSCASNVNVNTLPTDRLELLALSTDELRQYLVENGYNDALHINDKYLLTERIKEIQHNNERILRGEYDYYFVQKKNAEDEDDDSIVLKPIEAQIGDINCILIPYPQSVIDEIIKQHGCSNTNRHSYIFLSEKCYKQLCLFEYQRNYNGAVLFFHNGSDEEGKVDNAEEYPIADEKEHKSKDDKLITILKDRGMPDYLLYEVIQTMQNNINSKKKKKEKENVNVNSQDTELEFLDGEIPRCSYHKLVKADYEIPFYIYQDTKRCELLKTSKSLINILEYHRKKDDQESKSNENIKVLQNVLQKMIADNKDMMNPSKWLKSTQSILRFLEMHNEMELYEVIENKYVTTLNNYIHPHYRAESHARNTDDKIKENSVEYKKLMQIRERIWRNCCVSLEIPLITEPYLSRRMIAICDHTNTLPAETVFIQLRAINSSPKHCYVCSQQIVPRAGRCNNGKCCAFVPRYSSPKQHTKIIMMQSDALSPLCLKSYKTVYSQKLAKLYPNQNILIFSASIINSLSKTSSSNNDDTSYLNEYGRCKLFDCIIVPEFKYMPNTNDHVKLENDETKQHFRVEQYQYLRQFENSFFASHSSNIKSAGFDKGLQLQQPNEIKLNEYSDDDNDDDYENENENENEDILNAKFWNRFASWIWPPDRNKKILNMEGYIKYFVIFNANNYASDLRELFFIESQQNIGGMDSQKCRPLMKLYQHYNRLILENFSINIYNDLIYEINKFPHYMLFKPYSYRKHCASVSGYVFDQILELLPVDLRGNIFLKKCNIDQSLITDPQRDYTDDVMDPQEILWEKEEAEKKKKGNRCMTCNAYFTQWWKRKEHFESKLHRDKIDQLRLNKGDQHIMDYIEEVGALQNNKHINKNNKNDNKDPDNNDYNNNNSDNNNNYNSYNNNNYNNQNGVNNNYNNQNSVNNQNNVIINTQNIVNNQNNDNNNNDWIFDVQARIDNLITKIDKWLSEQREYFIKHEPNIKYTHFKRWHNELNEKLDLIKAAKEYENMLPANWLDGVKQWIQYLKINREKFKRIYHKTKNGRI